MLFIEWKITCKKNSGSKNRYFLFYYFRMQLEVSVSQR